MKKIINLQFIIVLITCMIITSCEEYLDKSPEASISEEEVFGTFRSYQGFVEELYHCIPDYTKSTWVADWNMADNVLPTTVDWRLITHFDNGDYWDWINSACGWNQSWLKACNGAVTTMNANEWQQKGLWDLSWYGIRKANVGLAHLDDLVEATQEEKDVIKGQLLFFRGFFHFQLMSFWGGLPYIDEVLGSGKLDLPRLTYQETAAKVARDLDSAALFLPFDWDNTTVGRATLGNNFQRITKSVAYAYSGKNYLFAGSPLMNKESTGNPAYDEELCKKAAASFYKCLYLSHKGQAPYQLTEWERYHENFYTLSNVLPGFPESLMSPRFFWNGPGYDPSASLWMPAVLGYDGNMVAPGHNYVKNFGMANGLPLDAEGSGYDLADPWSNRDPRFYEFIVHDGEQVIQGGDSTENHRRYANLYGGEGKTNGNYRGDNNGSRTGYMMKKFINLTANPVDAENQQRINLPSFMRLADVYLMYAEAVLHGYGTAQSSHPGESDYVLTAADAINVVRARANVGAVDLRFLGSKEDFMGEIIRERAVELMCEANIRFIDLRRWLLAKNIEYREKTSLDFDRDTVEGRFLPVNMRERVVVTRVVEDKHYWLPLPTNQVSIYPEFGQNPGW
ncbi:MAG: RagB/SusD family nutrient uptake outer membrane protein [Bacteroidales bacterium]|nr:RagB/SusD family nutrient uptake outer membrane protein [Bacteroidales bacterium]